MFISMSSMLRSNLSKYFARNGLKIRHILDNLERWRWRLTGDILMLRAKHTYSMFLLRYGEEKSCQ